MIHDIILVLVKKSDRADNVASARIVQHQLAFDLEK